MLKRGGHDPKDLIELGIAPNIQPELGQIGGELGQAYKTEEEGRRRQRREKVRSWTLDKDRSRARLNAVFFFVHCV